MTDVFPSYSYYVIILSGSHLNPQTPLNYAGRMSMLFSSWCLLIFLLRCRFFGAMWAFLDRFGAQPLMTSGASLLSPPFHVVRRYAGVIAGIFASHVGADYKHCHSGSSQQVYTLSEYCLIATCVRNATVCLCMTYTSAACSVYRSIP